MTSVSSNTTNLSPNTIIKDASSSNLGGINEVSVKVAVRVRPLSNREKLHQHQPCVRISNETNQIAIGKDKLFTFDYVLAPRVTQQDLYDTCVKSLVQSVFDGYNATVFAYGQTGSGKTYTISGDKSSVNGFGIIPRAVNTIFSFINQSSSPRSQRSSTFSNREFAVKVNFIEIYKEELKDLLDHTEKELQIREDESGNTIIYGANEVLCSTLDEVMSCFDNGTTLRHTGSTLMNEHSSRSHSVFTITIEQRWSDGSGKSVRDSAVYDMHNTSTVSNYYLGAKFHFVDLAGSERAHRTGNVGDRFKESIHINSGLLALGNVISALSSNYDPSSRAAKKIHIPYRDSKITRILKDSLGGNANTLMICCISPSSNNLDESINALKYASRARYIKNKPIVNVDPHSQKVAQMQSEIQALREELSRQRTTTAHLLMGGTTSGGHSQHHSNYDEEVKQLESRLQESHLEKDHYKKLVKEAYDRFSKLKTINNTDLFNEIIDEWIAMFEASTNRSEFNIDDYAKQKIIQLETQLKQAYDDLKSDEEIFEDKEREIKGLKETIADYESKVNMANRYLESAYQKEKEQSELMLQMQMQIESLLQQQQSSDQLFNKTNKAAGHTSQLQQQYQAQNEAKLRAKTAPINQGETEKTKHNSRAEVHSSPANFSLERVMQSFRARTQLLAETLEENDQVLQRKADLSQFKTTTEGLEADNLVEDVESDDNVEGHFVRRGTFKIDKPKSRPEIPDKTAPGTANKRSRTIDHPDSNKKVRDLSINIRMKEELIKELVANSKFTNRMNVQYQHKIESLQKEITQYKAEIGDLHTQIQQLTANSPVSLKDTAKTDSDLKRRLEISQQKVAELETRQKETMRQMSATSISDKKVGDVDVQMSKLRQQIDSLQKKLKEENDKRIKIEKDLEREQQRVKELEIFKEKQQQILKKKTEDLLTAQRRLRSNSNAGLHNEDNSTSASKHWVEQEMEKIIQEKRQMELFRDELQKREDLIKKKEGLLKEKNELEVKKLRASHAINQEKTSIKELEETHSNLIKQRRQIDEKLNKGDVLSALEERRLIEIDEAIEALEIAIEYENDTIQTHQNKLKDSILFSGTHSSVKSSDVSETVLHKLSTVPYEETKYLVKKFFQKVIDLKEMEQKKQLEISELQIQLEEQNRIVEQLKHMLNTSGGDTERRLNEQKVKYEKNQRQLMQQIAVMEKEMAMYKERLAMIKSMSKSNAAGAGIHDASSPQLADLSSASSFLTDRNKSAASGVMNKSHLVGGVGSESFFLKNNHNDHDLDKIANGVGANGSSTSRTIKVSRKDLRKLDDEELMQRSIKKDQK